MTQSSSYMTRRHRRSECWLKQPPVIFANEEHHTINQNHPYSRIERSLKTRDNANNTELSSSRQIIATNDSNGKRHHYCCWPKELKRYNHNELNQTNDWRNSSSLSFWSDEFKQQSIWNKNRVENNLINNNKERQINLCHKRNKEKEARPILNRINVGQEKVDKTLQNSIFDLPLRQATNNLIMSLRSTQKCNTQNLLVILFGIIVLVGTFIPITSHALATSNHDNSNSNNNNNNNNHNQLVEVHEYNDAILTPYIQSNGQFGGTLLGTSQHDNIKDIVGLTRKADDVITTSASNDANVDQQQAGGGDIPSLDAAASRFILTTSENRNMASGIPTNSNSNSNNNNNNNQQNFLMGQTGSINLPPGHQLQIDLNPMQQLPSTVQTTNQASDYRSLFMPAFVAGSLASKHQQQQQTPAITNGAIQAQSNVVESASPVKVTDISSTGATAGTGDDSMMVAGSHKHKKMKKKKEKKHKEWKKGKKHKKKKYESKKKKGGAMKKKKGKKEKKKWGMEKKGHKKKGNFKKKKWGHKKKKKAGKKGGKKGHKFFKDKGHKKKGFKKIYHKEEWGKKKKWHDVKREKKWNTKHKKWKKKWEQEKGKKYKGKHMKKYHKKNKHGKKYKKEKKSKYKKHKGEKYKKGHKKKKEEYAKKKEGGKKKMKKKESKKKKG